MSKNQAFFEKVNQAFATGDVDFLYEHVADDIVLHQVGQNLIEGKTNFIEEMEPMRGGTPEKYETKQIITHGNSAVIEGKMTFKDEEGNSITYAFCDIYKLNAFQNRKIKEITAYLIEV